MKARNVLEKFVETEIVVRARCLHTPFKGEAICEYQVEKHKNSKNCPSYGIHKRFWSNNGFYFRRWGFISIGVRNSCETHKTAPVLVSGGEIEWTRDAVSKGVVEMERIGWKGLPQLVYFSFTCLRSDNRVFPSLWDIIFLSFFLHFWNQLFGLIKLLKNFFFLFLLKHYLNNMHEISNGLEGVGWDDKDRLGSWSSLI